MKATCKVKRYLRFEGWDYAKGTSLSITIATAGEGLAIYWKADGPHVAGDGMSDSASNVRGGHALQQCCLPGFDPSNDGQTGFGQNRRGQ